MTRADLVRLLREHRLAVVSTLGPDGGPQSAVVGCAISDALEIVFDTLDKTRNLRRDPRISVRVRPRWIRWSDFNQRPPLLFECDAPSLA